MLDTARRVVTWTLGELPAARTPSIETRWLVLWAVLFASLAFLLGEHHGFRGDPVIKGSWRMLVHYGIPLAAVAGWEMWVRGRDRGRALVVMALIGAPIAARFTEPGLALLKEQWLLTAMPTALAAGLVIAGLHRQGRSLDDWSLGFGDWRWWLPRAGLIIVFMVPILVATVLLSPSLASFYPTWRPARTELGSLLWLHFGLLLDFIGWEYIFRGFLLDAWLKRGDPIAAICFQAVPYFLLHGDKPQLEMISSLFGGMLAGWFCIQARSSLPMVAIHWVMITTVGVTGFVLR